MSEWNFGRVVRVAAAVVVAYFYPAYWQQAAAVIMRENAAANASRQRRRAIQEYNEQVKDRLEMFEPMADAPRTLVLGRVRHVEGVRRRWASGTHDEKLTLIVSFAGHEIDAFESWYLDDKPVTLDSEGWVQEAPWFTSKHVAQSVTGTLDGSGNAALTLASAYSGSALFATWTQGTGENQEQGTLTVSVTGLTANVSGGPAGASVTVVYTVADATTRVRIRPYLGTASQNVGADLAAEYPGKITSTDKFAGIALAVVDIFYDPDVFPQGRPNITAVLRGAKCLDPRTNTTAWTENPALHAYHYARWASGWALTDASIRLADVEAAADVCDVSTGFVLTATGGGTTTETLPRYRCGITISAEADHAEAMGAIMETMAGGYAWAGGIWRMRAGAMVSPVATITEDWLVQDTRNGKASDEPVITAVQTITRAQRFNRVTGSCVDPDQRYQLLPFPAIQDDALVTAKGRRALEVQFQGVTHIAHAQHLASIIIRQAQAGLKLELSLGPQAADLEVFDVVEVTLDKYGYAAKTFEVIGWEWGQQGPYKVQLAEITADLFTVESPLTGRDPAPDSTLRAPWDVEQITGLAVTSGTTAQTDGSIISRVEVTWDAAVGQNIRQGGQVEVQYTEATGDLPDGEWPSWVEPGTATKAVIPGLLGGRYYLFRARAIQPPPTMVRGPWSAPVVRHGVAMPPDSALYSLDLGIPAITLAADSAGTVGSFAGATTTVRVMRSGADDTSAWTLSRVDGSGITSTLSTGTLSVTAMSVDSSYIDVTATRSGYDPLTQRLTVNKSRSGQSTFTATVYQQAASAPSAPTGGSYAFGAGTLTAPSGWGASLPAPAANATYATTFTFVGTTSSATVTGGTWGSPVQVAAGVPTQYIVSPGPYVITSKATATPTTCVAGLRFKTTGAIAEKTTATGSTYADTNKAWFAGGTPGATYYVRFVEDALVGGSLSGVGGGWLALTSDRTVTLTATAGVVADATVAYQVSADSSGGDVVSNGTIELHAEST